MCWPLLSSRKSKKQQPRQQQKATGVTGAGCAPSTARDAGTLGGWDEGIQESKDKAAVGLCGHGKNEWGSGSVLA